MISLQELDATHIVVERYYPRNCLKSTCNFVFILSFGKKQILFANDNELLLLCVLVIAVTKVLVIKILT